MVDVYECSPSVCVVLINDREDNLKAFLHRGLLYPERKQWQQAVSAFEAVIKLGRYSTSRPLAVCVSVCVCVCGGGGGGQDGRAHA